MSVSPLPSLRPLWGRRRLAVPVCAALIAACGTSAQRGGPGGGPLLKYAQCMRAHGLSAFPDPGTNGGGLVIPNSINPQSPTFKSAQHACVSLAQPPISAAGSSESRRLQLVGLARCMRAHGVPNFADPTSSPPPPSSGNAIGGNGWYLALGTPTERQSPAYKQAAGTCGGRLP